ncbi:MAG: hypothetical protein Q9163_003971 [Psora crenata]
MGPMGKQPQVLYRDFAYLSPEEYNPVHSWTLRKKSRRLQILTPSLCATDARYTIVSLQSQSYRKGNCGLVFRREHKGKSSEIAKAMPDAHGNSCMVLYEHGSVEQMVILEQSSVLRYLCQSNGTVQKWQSLGPSKSVLQLVNAAGKRIALFVCTRSTQHTDRATWLKSMFMKNEIGRMYVMAQAQEDVHATEQIICSAVIVNEMRKMSAAKSCR